MKQNYETGRSMVAMLGTLAIIGVLSVGGVMGYSYGMDKYRANQIINDIMLSTTDLLTQANQGHEALSLSEWDKEDTIYDFANPAYVEDENLIVLDVGMNKKMSKRVCEMVYDTLFNEAVQIDVNAVRADTNILCGKDNTMTFYFSTNYTAESNSTALTTTTEETTTTTEEVSEGNCASNSECNPNEYCAVGDYPVPEAPFPYGNKGICTSFDYYSHTITVNGVNEVWYVSKQSVENYWDAYHVCEKLSATMVSLEDLYSDTDFIINNYRADLLANVVHFNSGSSILVSDKKGLVARLGQYRTGGSFYDTGGFVLCYEGTLADLE